MSVHILLNITQEDKIHAVIMQYFDYNYVTLELIIRNQFLSEVIPNSLNFSYGQQLAPVFGLLKLYGNDNEPRFHLLYIRKKETNARINSIVSENTTFCPKADTFLVNQIKSLISKHKYIEFFEKRQNLSTHRHMICFHDDNYLCICESNFRRVECFGYDRSLDSCSYCLANGRCLKGDLGNSSNLLCLCPYCHYGHLCQFNTRLLSFTLNSLIAPNSFFVRILYLNLIIVLFVIGFFSNICSILTFQRNNPRKLGVGNYLLILSIINQLCILFLALKIFQVVLETLVQFSNVISCKMINYFLPVLTRINYWLSSWITIERLAIVLVPTMTRFRQPRFALSLSLLTVLIIHILHTHELIYYTVVQSMCVVNFEIHPGVAYYNRISVLIHYLLPFSIQIISITMLVWTASQSRAKLAKESFVEVLKKQFEKQKELYITPIIIVLCLLLQTVLAFAFACTKLNQSWQRHTLLIAYLLSYTPQILGFIFYVIPSTVYKNEFQQTWIGKIRYMKWLLRNR
ncbi:unnamed protein product [Adineta ricciae]|nr:unnamed protein product [Adineta ricciae]